jgi:hypothetical protein
MAVEASKKYYGGFGGFDENFVIMVRKDARIIIFWNAQQECHGRQCGTGVVRIDMRRCELPEGRVKDIC